MWLEQTISYHYYLCKKAVKLVGLCFVAAFLLVSGGVLLTWVKVSKMKIIFLFDFHKCSHGPLKFRRHFRKKSCSILKLSKMYFTKNVVLNWYSSMKFFFRKIRTFFDIEKWLWMSDLGTFLQPMWTSVKVRMHFVCTLTFATHSLIRIHLLLYSSYIKEIKSKTQISSYICSHIPIENS
jgi:hypothetical protein